MGSFKIPALWAVVFFGGVMSARSSILRCSEGELVGYEELADLFKQAHETCEHHHHPLHAYYNCIGVKLRVLNEDRTLEIENIENFYNNLFSKNLLSQIPPLREGLVECADAYVSSYNGMTKTEILTIAGELAGTFVYCVLDQEELYNEQAQKLCSTKIN